MADEVQTGRGQIFGIANNGTPITLSAFAAFILDTAKAVHKFKIHDIQDELEHDAAAVATNPHVEEDLTLKLTGASRATAAAQAVFLPPLAKVTISNFKVAVLNGDWQYRGEQAINLSHGPGEISLKVRKYDDATRNTELTTTIVG